MKVYLASSWRHPDLDAIRNALRGQGIEVYDFREQGGFNWRDVLGCDPARISQYEVLAALSRPEALAQFNVDLEALQECDVLLLVLPSGRSAHLEAGYFAGRGKPVFTLFAPNDGVDLMHLLLGSSARRCTSVGGALAALRAHDNMKDVTA